MAIEKWEVPATITELRAFLGFTNYYSSYIHEYAKIVAGLQDKLKVPHEVGKRAVAAKFRENLRTKKHSTKSKDVFCQNWSCKQ